MTRQPGHLNGSNNKNFQGSNENWRTGSTCVGFSSYHIYSPNTHHGEFLLNHEMREIRPDIVIEKEGRILAIIDAKYKPYRYFGKMEKPTHVDPVRQFSFDP